MSLLDHPIISERYFFPRPGSPRQALVLEGFDGTPICCSEKRPHEGAKTLIHYHGNGEIVADYDDGYLDSLCALGLNVVMVEYRGYGGSGGQTELGKMLQDVAAIREQLSLKSEETFVYGRSVGAIFAVEWAKLDPKIAGLILESGVADPYQRLAIRMEASELGATDEELVAVCHEHLNHRSKLAQLEAPVLVMHAAQDTLVTPDHAEAHIEYVPHEQKKLVLFPRGGHNTVLGANWQAYLQELKDFTESH